MKQILLFLLLACGATLAAASAPDKLSTLEAALNNVRQEQQSVYQNYQMTKELRLMEVQENDPATQQTYGSSINTPPPNYDDVVRARLEHESRIQQYTTELKSLSVRYLELEDQRKALLEQIRELARHPDE
ncbi:MAG TPA: hypothetical protein VFW53_07370 [Gallionella sp.]|nr:hypothetical protein [Gallionella sp.]